MMQIGIENIAARIDNDADAGMGNGHARHKEKCDYV
jgi:hypothetical protein